MNENSDKGPLTATVGERLKGDPHVEEVKAAVGKGSAAETGGERSTAEPRREAGAGASGSPARRSDTGGQARRERQAGVQAKRPEQGDGQARRGGHAGGATQRPFPWAALALAAIGWALLSGIGSGVRSRARRVRKGVSSRARGAATVVGALGARLAPLR